MAFNEEKVREAINDLAEWEQVNLWNERCEDYNYMDDYIHNNDPDELMCGQKPSDILSAVDMDSYSLNDDWACYATYGWTSFSWLSDRNSPFDIDELVSQALGNIETQANDIKRKNDDADAYSIHNGFTFAADAKSDDVASENELKSHSSKYEETSQESVKLVDLGEKPITQTVSSEFAPTKQSQKSIKPAPKKSKKKGLVWFIAIVVTSVLIAGAALLMMIEII